ncbi:hypothetical protein BABINDRAFT_160476 [Babjeviella inositovora NRRL Y-12698]|uniref:PX domain-containing protein n=1 Tax=Babjeviella inositovora NRRL Y-12698 TaxID=984486 RepID=A0A1E3QTR5_9ASCO|nr:uncharacterized protein BABINDRAFT_160476 [Babjeviella inositovora NRRL Y-12698]ODQ81060.1 hypothetical protein BABINDRAFT_160476 [Babjeviella inositovora NRRL Y-12698]
MADDDISGSMWGDAPRKTIVDVPVAANPFAEDDIFARPDPPAEQSTYAPFDEPLSGEFGDMNIIGKEENDDEEEEAVAIPQKPVQGTSHLISELAGEEVGITMNTPSGSLFGDKNPLLSADEDTDDTARAPVKKVARGVASMYKARGRNRREPKPLANTNPLGPLGPETDTTAEENSTNISAAELLTAAADGPLFHIKKPEPEAPAEPIVQEIQSAPKAIEAEAPVALEISVGDPVKIGELTSAHIVYTITSKSALLSDGTAKVTRRYKDFRWIYHQLQNNHPGFIVPPPPSKQAVGRFNEEFVESRRMALETMLQKIARNAMFQKDPDLLMFLASENFGPDAKARELATGSAASTIDEEDDEGSSSSSGFMNSFSKTLGLSTGPKYVEEDEWFVEKRTYIELLEINLGNIYKNLELVVQQRTELATMTAEFLTMMDELAALDASGDIFQESSISLLMGFGSTQSKLKDLVARSLLQDMLTLGSTIDEYLRIVGSVKHCFSQRVRLKTALLTQEAELTKLQKLAAKTNVTISTTANNVAQKLKLALVKEQITKQESKTQGLEKKFKQITVDIKNQLGQFETNKINDFRNAVETFLESNIELQKESIELWETFYERHHLSEIK